MTLTINIPTSTLQILSEQLAVFTDLAKKRDPRFVSPSLEEFAQAKLSGETSWLGVATIESLVQSSPYRDARRVMREDFAAFLKNFVLSSRLHGFAFIHASGKSGTELREMAGEWLNHLSQIEPLPEEFRDALSAMIEGASLSIDDAEEIYRSKIWKTADSLASRFQELLSALPMLPAEEAPARLAQFITVGEIAVEMGVVTRSTLETAMLHLRSVRPDFFAEADGPSLFSRAATKVLACFTWQRMSGGIAG